MRTQIAVLAGASLLAACEAAPRIGAKTDPGGGVQAGTFASIVQDVLVPRCATSACHAGGIPPPNAPLNLEAENAYAQLVGAPATQLPTMTLVEPGDPANSYLLLKLRGTAGDAGGTPGIMPLYEASLDDAELAAIEAWISEGAPND
jgi:hypothetical protein